MRKPLPLFLLNRCRLGCENTRGEDGSAADCPQGFEWRSVGALVRGKQCSPASVVVEHPTCSSYRDLSEDKGCIFNAQCGATGDSDALRVDVDGDNNERCTLPCALDGRCPAACTCGPSPAGSGAPGAYAPVGL